jgi:hypothetical protein
VLLRLFRNRGALAIVLLVGSALLAANALSGIHFAKNWASILVSTAVLAGVVTTLRFNFTAYVVMYAMLSGLGRVSGAWRHDGLRPFAIQAGIALLVVLAGAALWAMAQRRRGVAMEAMPPPVA